MYTALFKFNLGDIVADEITGFSGIITCRSDWQTGCNTYGVQSRELQDGIPIDARYFDEMNLSVVKESVVGKKGDGSTGGPSRPVPTPNR